MKSAGLQLKGKAANVLRFARMRATGPIRPSDIIAAILSAGEAHVLAALGQAITPGASLNDLLEVINVYNPPGISEVSSDSGEFHFSPEMSEALKDYSEELDQHVDGSAPVEAELLLYSVLKHLDDQDREFLTILDVNRALESLNDQVKRAGESIPALFDRATGRLKCDAFTEEAWIVMHNAAVHAGELGYDRLLPPHLFLALLEESDGPFDPIIRLQGKPEIGPGKLGQITADAFRLSSRKLAPVELGKELLAEVVLDILQEAQRSARLWKTDRVGSLHLLIALLDHLPPRLASLLEGPSLEFNVDAIKTQLEKQLREESTSEKREVPFRLQGDLLPYEDLTYLAKAGELAEAFHLDHYFDTVLRALYRRSNNNVAVTGLKGVGKTSLVRELARRAANDEVAFLRRKKFLWIDCRDIAPEESKKAMGWIMSQVVSRTDIILCIDGLGTLLRAESGGNNKVGLRRILKQNKIQVIGIMSNWDYEDLVSSDHDTSILFTRVNVEEPSEDIAMEISHYISKRLSQEFGVSIDKKAVERAVILSSEYILNERLPAKAIGILRQVCEDIEYQRTQLGGTETGVHAEDVIRVISAISGVPEESLSGVGQKADYEKDLAKRVVGQDAAVKAVASDLTLIKAGLTHPGKPAAVMLFAGMTGVGKTELAKTIASFYSASKRLQTYTMGNFTEAFTISQIIGVPPGYVGYDQGGRLINDLNSDPYCVFLLDEAEKAHPDIWKPFLNLFDEGWIVDTRGVKAFADRAIFILTSNAGADIIAHMSAAGRPTEEIVEAVKSALSEIRHQHSGQIVFSPEFLARIGQIIIFKPLNREDMTEICRLVAAQMQKKWFEKREKKIVIPDELIQFVGARGHVLNEQSGGKEGGRIVNKLLRQLVEVNIQKAATDHAAEYHSCDTIEIGCRLPSFRTSGPLPEDPEIHVIFRGEEQPQIRHLVANTVSQLRGSLEAFRNHRMTALTAVSDCLEKLEVAVSHSGADRSLIENLREAHSELERLMDRSAETTANTVEGLVKQLNHVS